MGWHRILDPDMPWHQLLRVTPDVRSRVGSVGSVLGLSRSAVVGSTVSNLIQTNPTGSMTYIERYSRHGDPTLRTARLHHDLESGSHGILGSMGPHSAALIRARLEALARASLAGFSQ